MSSITESGITISIENNIQVLRFNNPRKKNAIQVRAYDLIKDALNEAANNSKVSLTVMTGTGDYYCSGFDMTDPECQSDPDDARKRLKVMLDAIIDYPKLLIGVVNGPAIGLAVTILGLCDIVYATNKASFMTPFSKLGLCAEGCATYTFPRILGKSKANEMLLVGHKMTAEEAWQFGFVSKVYKHSEINQIWKRISEFIEVTAQSIQVSKKMTRHFDRQYLLDANQMELDNLKICLQSEECANAIIQFLTRKSKL